MDTVVASFTGGYWQANIAVERGPGFGPRSE